MSGRAGALSREEGSMVVEVQYPGHASVPAAAAFWPVVTQMVVLDAVFSLGSVITAIGMEDEIYMMMAAVIIAVVVVMLAAAKPRARGCAPPGHGDHDPSRERGVDRCPGLALAILGRLPERGDVVEWGGWKLEVAAMDGLGVERIVARRAQPANAA